MTTQGEFTGFKKKICARVAKMPQKLGLHQCVLYTTTIITVMTTTTEIINNNKTAYGTI